MVLKSQNNYGSIEHSTVILHEPSFESATVNGLCRNYSCGYIGHNVNILTITRGCEGDKKFPASLQACVS